MNPFFLNSALIFDRFEAAFREHDRIFESLRGRWHEDSSYSRTRDLRDNSDSHYHRNHTDRNITTRDSNRSIPIGYASRELQPVSSRRDLFPTSSRPRQSTARQNTLAREGIKPTSVNKTSNGSTKKTSSSTRNISTSSGSRLATSGRPCSGWQPVAGCSEGGMSLQGLHMAAEGRADKANLFIYHKHTQNERLQLLKKYRIGAQFKLVAESANMLNLVLGYRDIGDFFVLNVDILQRTMTLLHCDSLPDTLEQLLNNRKVCSESFVVSHSIAQSRFYSFELEVSQAQVLVKINQAQIWSFDLSTTENEKSARLLDGSPGILCLRGTKLIFKEWTVKMSGDDAVVDTARSEGEDCKPSQPSLSTTVDEFSSKLSSTARVVSQSARASIIQERLKTLKHDSKLVEVIANDIISSNDVGVHFQQIASLEDAKRVLNEAVALPLVMPEFFTGLREPWKGVLLFGPPGTGKTMLAKAIASMNHCTFFNCSSSSLISKWRGESEKLVKCLFDAARACAPSVIFLDEIDALVSARGGEGEHEASRRLKTEFFSQMDGICSNTSSDSNSVMVLATTNCPWDLDAAMLRRLEKRIYIPLPDHEARVSHFKMCIDNLCKNQPKGIAPSAKIADEVVLELATLTEGFSGADIVLVCKEAAMAPMRRLLSQSSIEDIQKMRADGTLDIAEITMADYINAIKKTKPSVQRSTIESYESWNQLFASS